MCFISAELPSVTDGQFLGCPFGVVGIGVVSAHRYCENIRAILHKRTVYTVFTSARYTPRPLLLGRLSVVPEKRFVNHPKRIH